MPTRQRHHSQVPMRQSWQMRFARHYENQISPAERSKRVIVQKLRNRKNTNYSVVNLQKRGGTSEVSTRRATYGWRHLVIRAIRARMRLADLFSCWLPVPFSFRD